MIRMKSAFVCLLLAASALAACEVGPNYHRPAAPEPQAYKEVAGWTAANPSDAADRADWWTVFGDPVLDDLEQKVAVSNQNLAAAEAAYQAAHALVAEQRANLFPNITATGSASGSGGGGPPGTAQSYRLGLGGTWEPDLWGRIRRGIENAKANAQTSAADVVNARLSAQLELAADYITLRQFDEQKRIDDATVAAFGQSLDITRNKYNAGTVSLSDVRQAETQLYNERALDTDLEQQRARVEHAIAILTGQAPADVSIAPAPWTLKPVEIPPGVPSTLLQRRPDIAASERQAAAASANIGVQTAGYFPNLTLTGGGGTEAAQIGQLFSPQSFFWSLGASAAQTVFDAGATHARVSQAKAQYDQAVANYRQTVLTALGQVEDNLAAQRVLAAELVDRQATVAAADSALTIAENQYKAGTVDYTTVVTAQTADLSAHNAELALEAGRLTTTVDLIVALGGGWNAEKLPRD